MARPPVPRSAGNSPAVPDSARRAPGAIGYEDADAVGFDQMPRSVVDALAGVLLGPPIAADAEPLVAKRRGGGTHYQQATGWWAGGDRYVSIDARRLLAPTEGQRLKPVTGWKIDGTVRYFAAGVLPTYSQWRFDAGVDEGAGKGRRSRTDDPLDVLPEQLTAPVRGANANAWRGYGPGWAEETIVAALTTPNRVRILKAQRKATSRRGLGAADWHAVTLEAPIVAVQALATDSYGRVLLGPAAQPTLSPPGTPPGVSIGTGR